MTAEEREYTQRSDTMTIDELLKLARAYTDRLRPPSILSPVPARDVDAGAAPAGAGVRVGTCRDCAGAGGVVMTTEQELASAYEKITRLEAEIRLLRKQLLSAETLSEKMSLSAVWEPLDDLQEENVRLFSQEVL